MVLNNTNVGGRSRNLKISVALVVMFIISSFAVSGKLSAQSATELQSQIDVLLATVKQLQQQLSLLQGNEISNTGQFNFSRDLKLGDTGLDVKELQIKLNSNKSTQVAVSGAGSPGNETTYFGLLTKNAAIKLQELHKASILTPAGLAYGTGYVGPLTRSYLNKDKKEQTGVTNADNADSVVSDEIKSEPNVAFQDYDDLVISFPSIYEGPPGIKVSISGIGFTREGNVVHLGDTISVSGISSPSGAQISFSVPADTTYGKYDLYVTNSKGESNKKFFIVKSSQQANPTIESSTPTEGLYGAEITIVGSGFTDTGNDIYTGYNVITNVPSPDGKTLKFKILPFPEIPELQVGVDLGQDIEWPIKFYVINENGISETSSEFILKI